MGWRKSEKALPPVGLGWYSVGKTSEEQHSAIRARRTWPKQISSSRTKYFYRSENSSWTRPQDSFP